MSTSCKKMQRKREDSPDASTVSASDDGDSYSGTEFEVFLNFRGLDTRLNFTDALYHALVKAGVRVFRDNEEIRQGETIGDELLHAIKSSKIYVPIFSRNYASSVWCLRELTHIVECSSKAKDKMILPIFYDVDPDDVKLRTRLYLDALEKHEEKFGSDFPQWKEALTEVARIRGSCLKNRGYGEIINIIIGEVLNKLMKGSRNLPEHLVGIDNCVKDVRDLLNEGPCDVCYLVIHGMGGIGKTTLASAVYNRISNQFEGCSFLSDVRESAQRGNIIDLQKQLLSDILQGGSREIYDSVNDGTNIIRERFRDKKVLLILDDVDKRDQLSKLAGKSNWFGPGSKIIITTRNIDFLPIKEEDEESSRNQTHSDEFKFYEMEEMDFFDALTLFSQHALGMDSPPPDYEDISRKITSKTGGLPLALEVIGSSLFGKKRTIWKDTLKKLDSVPNQDVFNKLNISYDMLDYTQKEIFLDIACFFIGEDRLCPYYMWKASNYFPKTNILVLTRMSLIKIEEDDGLGMHDRGGLWMHDQLRDLGREIIRLENSDPAKRSRLWMPETALNVVQQKEGTDKIVALRLTRLSKVRNFTSNEFSKLPNLRFLELDGGNLVGDFKNLLSKLTWLYWHNCPSKLKAKNLCLENLALLTLEGSDDTEEWDGWGQCLVSENLRVIHIYHFPGLKRTPDFSQCKNLKRLSLLDCSTSLVADGSLSKLEHLKHLEIIVMSLPDGDDGVLFAEPSALGGQRSLSTLTISDMDVGGLHHFIGERTPLKYLSLYSCLPETLPESIGKLKLLLELELGDMEITELPHSIGDLKKLTKMVIWGTPIKKLPDSIGGLESLIELSLASTEITELPASIGNLKRLEILCLSNTMIRELPKTVGMLENLKKLNASSCKNLEGEIPSEIGALCCLRKLNLEGTNIRRLPTSMNQLSHIQKLDLGGCDKFEQFMELPMSLKELSFSPHLLWTSIDLSYLTNLIKLSISQMTNRLSEFGERAPNIEWIKGLSKLESLYLVVEDVTFPPIDLAALFRLRTLDVTCVDPQSLMGLPSSLEKLTLYNLKSPLVRLPFSNLTNLSSLSLYTCWLTEVEFDDVLGRMLEKLSGLNVSFSELLERLSVSGLSRAKGLKWLIVSSCPRLMEIQGLEKLESLEKLHIYDGKSLKRLPDLSELKKLQHIRLQLCPLIKSSDLRLQKHVIVQRN